MPGGCSSDAGADVPCHNGAWQGNYQEAALLYILLVAGSRVMGMVVTTMTQPPESETL